MLFFFSPAKTMDTKTPWPASLGLEPTQPLFTEATASLVRGLRSMAPDALQELLEISSMLAQRHHRHYQDFALDDPQGLPALWSFRGPSYVAWNPRDYGPESMQWAQDHLCILSGLYGLLRPLDCVQPYRLDMGTRWAFEGCEDLYDWWSKRVSKYLCDRTEREGHRVGVLLSSQEYSRLILPMPWLRWVTVVFQEKTPRGWQAVGVHAKKARGTMLDWVIRRRLGGEEAWKDITLFDGLGYRFEESVSSEDSLVFRRTSSSA
jgi:cytoplasmic iron level regulating protein YaaA (DUF328/UPF0246 family)